MACDLFVSQSQCISLVYRSCVLGSPQFPWHLSKLQSGQSPKKTQSPTQRPFLGAHLFSSLSSPLLTPALATCLHANLASTDVHSIPFQRSSADVELQGCCSIHYMALGAPLLTSLLSTLALKPESQSSRLAARTTTKNTVHAALKHPLLGAFSTLVLR